MEASVRTVVLLSGGIDSTVLLAHLLDIGRHCYTVSVNYGQRHIHELEAAKYVANSFGVPNEVVIIPNSLMAGSSLTGSGEVPCGHYTDPRMRATVVPARNTVLLAIAAAVAVREGCNGVAYAAHSGDHTIYPDCRPEFVWAFGRVLSLCDYNPLELLVPFVSWSKTRVVERGNQLRAPLRLTWSCYNEGELHCGKCGACIERKEAFSVAEVPDPTDYGLL